MNSDNTKTIIQVSVSNLAIMAATVLIAYSLTSSIWLTGILTLIGGFLYPPLTFYRQHTIDASDISAEERGAILAAYEAGDQAKVAELVKAFMVKKNEELAKMIEGIGEDINGKEK